MILKYWDRPPQFVPKMVVLHRISLYVVTNILSLVLASFSVKYGALILNATYCAMTLSGMFNVCPFFISWGWLALFGAVKISPNIRNDHDIYFSRIGPVLLKTTIATTADVATRSGGGIMRHGSTAKVIPAEELRPTLANIAVY